MRIALTIHAMHGGGAERLMSQLAAWWTEAGHELHLITWADAGTDRYPLPQQLHRVGLGLTKVSRNRWHGMWANVQRVRMLRATLRTIEPELILSFCDQMNIATLQAAKRFDIPVWIAEHSNPARQRLSPAWEFWRRRTYPHCTGCVVLTDSIRDYLARWIPRARIVVIPNAIQPPPPATQALGPSQPQVLLTLGRLSREKGIDVLLTAWRRVRAELPHWQLTIVGDGPERAALEASCRGLDSVSFRGWVDDPWSAYRAASLFVMPSRYEGFPVALLEAMSQNLPCIATRCSQAVEQLARGETSLHTVAPESPEQLADAILQLALNPDRRQQLGIAAHEVSLDYTWSRIGPQWDSLLVGQRHFET